MSKRRVKIQKSLIERGNQNEIAKKTTSIQFYYREIFKFYKYIFDGGVVRHRGRFTELGVQIRKQF